jgi:hypothetical protein
VIVKLIIICEVAFWVLLVGGLALRYVARAPRTGAAVLLCEPLLELVLFVVSAMDLRNGGEPDWKHGLAAAYIGFTVTYGYHTIKWADGHFLHRFAGGPLPAKAPRYGKARAVHEWKLGARAIGGAAIGAALLQLGIWYVGDAGQSASLRDWQLRLAFVAVLSAIIPATYTIFPKSPKGKGLSPEREHTVR